MFPSDIVLSALQVSAQGVPYQGLPTHCSHCGKPICEGDLHEKTSVGAFFSDTRDLLPTGVVCGACVVMRSKKAMNGLSFSVTTREAVYPIAKDENKAWLLLTPPEPPFVAVLSSATMMHLVWRTPVTLSKDLIRLRYGNDLLTIRPAKLRQMIESAQSIQVRRVEAGEKKPHLSPFRLVDRDMRHPDHGQLDQRAVMVMTVEERQFFSTLTVGEVWASSILLKTHPAEPAQPEPKVIDFNGSAEEELSL